MISGKREELSIEYIVNHKNSDHIIFGNIAIWAGGSILGDISQTVILNVPRQFFAESLKYCGHRKNELFNKMNSQEIWEFLYLTLYGNFTELELEDTSKLEDKYRKFCICPGFSEAFDGEMAFLIEDNEGERFIWRDYESQQIKEVRIYEKIYKNVVESFVNDQIFSGCY